MSQVRAAAKAYPTLLRVGVAEAVAYRAELVVWMLTTTLPLVNMALWTAVAREGGPVAGYGAAGFVAYFLGALFIRQVTGSWVLWEMNNEIRNGKLSARLLRPLHPLVTYSAENLGALPMRMALLVPLAAALIALVSPLRAQVVRDPVEIAILAAALASAWVITFCVMALLGTLCFYIESALGAFDVYFAIYSIFSGYFVPLSIFPRWLTRAAAWMPFRYQLAFPVELAIGRLGRGDAIEQLGAGWAWALGLAAITWIAWRRGVRKYAAFGS